MKSDEQEQMFVGDIWQDDPDDYDSDGEIWVVTEICAGNVFGLILGHIREEQIGSIAWISSDNIAHPCWKLVARGQ